MQSEQRSRRNPAQDGTFEIHERGESDQGRESPFQIFHFQFLEIIKKLA